MLTLNQLNKPVHCFSKNELLLSFSHRNSCNQCELAISPKDNKSGEHHEEINVNVKNLYLSQICLILSLYTTVITYKDLSLFSVLEGGGS